MSLAHGAQTIRLGRTGSVSYVRGGMVLAGRFFTMSCLCFSLPVADTSSSDNRFRVHLKNSVHFMDSPVAPPPSHHCALLLSESTHYYLLGKPQEWD